MQKLKSLHLVQFVEYSGKLFFIYLEVNKIYDKKGKLGFTVVDLEDVEVPPFNFMIQQIIQSLLLPWV